MLVMKAVDPVGKALWYIESHFGSEISLADVASAGGVSRFHMSRVFSIATGHSLADYIRGRRLSEAARSLASGAPDILTVALDAGYGSHEAFTRAFRERFGLTPEMLRAQRQLGTIALMEAMRVDTIPTARLQSPRIEKVDLLLITGLGARYSHEDLAGIPAQWQRFAPHIGSIPGQIGTTTYGVRTNSDDSGSFDYICGVAVTDFSATPPAWSRIRIAGQRYAVFLHNDHISAIRATCTSIWNEWLPRSQYEPADGPDLERYGAQFDPHTGFGGVEIWVPIRS